MSESVLVPFPKPVPKCKHKFGRPKRIVQGKPTDYEFASGEVSEKIWVRVCAHCSFAKPIKKEKPPKPVSAKRRKRISAWPAIRHAVFEYCKGVCFWCRRFCPEKLGTADHAEPDDGKNAVETNLNWCHNWPFPASCHGMKSHTGNQGIVIALQSSIIRYRDHGFDRPLPDPTTMDKAELSVERAECNIYLATIQARIERGEIPRSQGWPC